MVVVSWWDEPLTYGGGGGRLVSIGGWACVRLDWDEIDREARRRAPILTAFPSLLGPVREKVMLDMLAPFVLLAAPCHDEAGAGA